MKKIRPIKNTWYDWLINYISEPKRKSVCGFKGKIVSLFKTKCVRETKQIKSAKHQKSFYVKKEKKNK